MVSEAIEKRDVHRPDCRVVRTWNHGGWANGTFRTLDQIDFGTDTSQYFCQKVKLELFAYGLMDAGQLPYYPFLRPPVSLNTNERGRCGAPRDGVDWRR
jgi:hypothetical protein